jgi:hypothetical protein
MEMYGIVKAYFITKKYKKDLLLLVKANTTSNPTPQELITPIKIHIHEATRYLKLNCCLEARNTLGTSVL